MEITLHQNDRTLGTRGLSRVRREFSVYLTETENRARKVSGTQGKTTGKQTHINKLQNGSW